MRKAPNKQLQRTVETAPRRTACASFHYAHAARFTRQRAAAELRRYARVTIAALLAMLVVLASAARSETWVFVEGGAWTPDSDTVARVLRGVEQAFARLAKGHDDVPAWETYTIQYQGQLENGAQVVKVFGMCEPAASGIAETFDLRTEFVGGNHGGPCFFRALYDRKTDGVLEFRFHDTYP